MDASAGHPDASALAALGIAEQGQLTAPSASAPGEPGPQAKFVESVDVLRSRLWPTTAAPGLHQLFLQLSSL